MLNTIKLSFYRFYSKTFFPHTSKSGLFAKIAYVIEKMFGYAIIKVDGCNFHVGPVSLLDRFLLNDWPGNNELMEITDKFLKDGDVFLDMGANMGRYTFYAGKNEKAIVLAFEPSARELKKLHANLTVNNNKNIILYPFGLSDKYQTVSFKISSELNPGKNSVYGDNDDPYAKSEDCRFARLDHLVPEDMLKKAKVCKIDVEGYEVFVLHGMDKSMEHLKDCIFVIEMSPTLIHFAGCKLEQIYEFFKKHGFTHKNQLATDHQYEEIFYHPDRVKLD